MSLENSPTVCVLGFGMAGRPIARGLADAGAAGVRVWKRPPWRPEHIDASDHPAILMTQSMEEALEGADLVLSLLTPESALEAARSASPFIRNAVYADLNTMTPEAKKEIGRAIEAGGGSPVDGAICDPAEVYGHKVVTLISGPEARRLSEAMARYGMQLQVLSDRVGDASALKVVRSVFTKGLMMTFLEAIEAARRCGLVEELLESIAGTVEGLPLRDLALSLAGDEPHRRRKARAGDGRRRLDARIAGDGLAHQRRLAREVPMAPGVRLPRRTRRRPSGIGRNHASRTRENFRRLAEIDRLKNPAFR